MTADKQIDLRDTILALVLPTVESPTLPSITAAIAACSGAAAVVIALMPSEAHRRAAVQQLVEHLPLIVEKRAAEIRSGQFDRDLQRSQH